MAHHPTSSRVFDAVFESPVVPQRARNKFVLKFVGHFHELVDDRFGSRVGDRMWAGSDPYLKVNFYPIQGSVLITASMQEKIAKSLQSYEQNLAGSQYGKYFVRNMNLLLLKRDPDAWRAGQVSKKEAPNPSVGEQGESTPISAPEKLSELSSKGVPPKLSLKRKAKEGDDIERLFDSTLGKKRKRSALPLVHEERKTLGNPDAGLGGILGAIKDAPKGEKDKKYRKKKVG